MMEIDNRSIRLGDELKKEIKPGSKVKIAAATFSMFAFQQLKEELETIEELKFIFTNPTFVTDETRVGYREYRIDSKTLIEKNWAMILLCSKPHGISTMLH